MNTNQTGFAPILIILLILIIGTVGYFVLIKKPESKPEPVTQQPQSSNIVTPPQKPVDETAQWKTYKNEVYGFEFKYPSHWKIRDNGNGGVILNPSMSPASFEVAIDYGSPRLNEPGYVAQIPPGVEVNHQESSTSTFAGISARKEILKENYAYYISPTNNEPYPSPKITTSIFFSDNIPGTRNIEHFKIQFSPSLDVFEQILSTFRFTK